MSASVVELLSNPAFGRKGRARSDGLTYRSPMRREQIHSNGVLGPRQLSSLATLYDETISVLSGEGSPYVSIDRERLKLEVARALIDAARDGASEPAMIELAVLRHLSKQFRPKLTLLARTVPRDLCQVKPDREALLTPVAEEELNRPCSRLPRAATRDLHERTEVSCGEQREREQPFEQHDGFLHDDRGKS